MKSIRPLLLLIVTLALAVPALAHSALLDAEPYPGSTSLRVTALRLVYGEPLLPESRFSLAGADLQPVPVTPGVQGKEMRAELARPLPFGVYTVQWTAVVEDGQTEGTYQFTVGVPSWAWFSAGALLVILAGLGVWWFRFRPRPA